MSIADPQHARDNGFERVTPTNLIQHLITLIEDKDLDAAQSELLVADQGV